jgi:hypothetical protein
MNNNQLNFAVGITPHSRNIFDRIEEASALKKSVAKMLSDENYQFAITDKDVICDDIRSQRQICFVISIIPHSSQHIELVREDLEVRRMICKACKSDTNKCMVVGTDNEACDMSKLPRNVRL